MKVALLSPFIYPIVKPFVGGLEAYLFSLATALVRQGVEVICYACEGSEIPGVEIRTCGVLRDALVQPRTAYRMKRNEVLSLQAYEDAVMWSAVDDACNDSSIDILHNNSFSSIPIFLSTLSQTPILHTLHVPPEGRPALIEAMQGCRQHNRSLHFVACSQAHAKMWENYYPVRQIVYCRFDTRTFPPYSTAHEGRLAFVGRISPTKGVEDAIALSVMLSKQLDIYGSVVRPLVPYFETRIQPLLQKHTNVTYHGSVDQETLWQGLRRAQALVFPVKWNEPGGTAVAEAMAVGTPVVMYDRGPARELIVEGVNGFVVASDNLQEMAAAVAQTEQIDRARCSTQARERFDIAISVQQYLDLYQSLL